MAPLIPELKEEVLKHRRIMIWMENKSKGWFPGVVSGATKRKGYDFTVKFDKAETASIDIDGIKSCKMTANGEHGYGRSWAILEDDPEYVPKCDQTLNLQLFSSINNKIICIKL